MYILEVLKQSFDLFNRKQKFHFSLLLVFFLISAAIQILGVASIGPFIAILSSPEMIHSNPGLSLLYKYFLFTDTKTFTVFIAGLSLAMILASNIVAVLTLWLLMKFCVHFGEDLQGRLFTNFIGRPYTYHKSFNYNKSISAISQEAPRFVYMVLQPSLLMLSNLFVAALILVGLLVLNPFIAIGAGLLIGGTYLVTYLFLKASLSHHGKLITDRNRTNQAILSETFIGIKDIILNSLGEKYVNRFRSINMQGLKSTAFVSLSGDIPKFVIETISFGAILLLAIIFLLKSESNATIVSMLSIYALAGYKLLPTMQQVYKSVSTLGAHGSVAFELKNMLQHPSSLTRDDDSQPLEHVQSIALDKVNYAYPNAKKTALHDISIKFSIGELNTIAGRSGSGKSTLVDIILGLLDPSSGTVSVDGKAITSEFLPQYQKSIGYVPQNIFILDDTVIANVAFGVPADKIDTEKVIAALINANAYEFVKALPDGIHSHLGQDGKLLSGGQRQRIGIARSLYRDTKILILDEPTSALDVESEYDFMQLLTNLKKNVLIIVISHRPAAIKLSDTITLLEDGKIEASGSIQELLKSNLAFKDMLEKSMIN